MDTKKIAQKGLISMIVIGVLSFTYIGLQESSRNAKKQSIIEKQSIEAQQKTEKEPVIMTLAQIPEDKIDTSNIYIDADLLVKTLNSSRLRRKDEYETQQQYDEYVSNYYKTVSFYKFNKDEMVVLATDKRLKKVKYDPEKQQAYARIDKSLWIKFKEQSEGEYLGSNAFGATKAIEKETQNIIGVEFRNYDSLKIEDYEMSGDKRFSLHSRTANILIPMNSSEARQLVPKLDVIYLAKITPPFIDYSREHTKPTMDLPIDRTVSKYTIFSNLLAVLIINKDSGEIIAQKTF